MSGTGNTENDHTSKLTLQYSSDAGSSSVSSKSSNPSKPLNTSSAGRSAYLPGCSKTHGHAPYSGLSEEARTRRSGHRTGEAACCTKAVHDDTREPWTNSISTATFSGNQRTTCSHTKLLCCMHGEPIVLWRQSPRWVNMSTEYLVHSLVVTTTLEQEGVTADSRYLCSLCTPFFHFRIRSDCDGSEHEKSLAE